MTRDEAERLRLSDRHWTLGVIYHCREDPRIVVRNRWIVGWTWNFSHPWVFPALLGTIALVLGPSAILMSNGRPGWAFAAAGIAVGVVVILAHRHATGPRQ